MKHNHHPQVGDRLLLEHPALTNLGQVAVVTAVEPDRAGLMVRYTVEDAGTGRLTGRDGGRDLRHFASYEDAQAIWIRLAREAGQPEWIAYSDELGEIGRYDGSPWSALTEAKSNNL